MKKVGILLLTLSLIISLILPFTSCSKSVENNMNIEDSLGRTCYAYTSETIEINDPEHIIDVYSLIEDNDVLYAVLIEYDDDTLETHKNKLKKISFDDETSKDIVLNDNANIYAGSAVKNNRFYYVNWDSTFEILDIDSEEIVYSQMKQDVIGVAVCDDGYILTYTGRVEKYNDNNNLVATIENDEWFYYNSQKFFYQSEESYYLIADTGFSYKYYKLDFETGNSELIFSPRDVGINPLDCSAQYMFTDDGEFLMDYTNNTMIPLAYWNEIDFIPPNSEVNFEGYVGISNEKFAHYYSYMNGIVEITLYSYDFDNDYSDRIPLVVGGIGCMNDIPLRWAVYNYNTSQTEYRVYIEDYTKTFGWNDGGLSNDRYLELISYFEHGNTPDIYYGQLFDFDYFYENGLTQNIVPFLDVNLLDSVNGITDNIKALMFKNDECYRLFASYQLTGYVGSYEFFCDDNDVSFDDLVQLENQYGITPISPNESRFIAREAIAYSINQRGSYSAQEIQSILEFSYNYGFRNVSGSSSVWIDSNTIHQYGLFSEGIYSPYYFFIDERDCQDRLVYVGYPSLYGSCHVLYPIGQLGLSSDTLYPEACSEFMMHLLDDNVQKYCYMDSQIPVVDEMLEQSLTYYQNHDAIPEDDVIVRRQFDTFEEITPEAAEDYRIACHSADTIDRVDWGIVDMVSEEVMSYYSDKSIEEIANTIASRLNIYLDEN